MKGRSVGDSVTKFFDFLSESEFGIQLFVVTVIASVGSPLILTKFSPQIRTYLLRTIGNDDNVGFRQASEYYKLLMKESFSNLLGCYFDQQRRIQDAGNPDPLDDNTLYEKVRSDIDTEFQRIRKEIDASLTLFKFKGVSLTQYLNDNFDSEFRHVQDGVAARILTRSNGGREYLRNKQDFFISDFAIWLKGVENEH